MVQYNLVSIPAIFLSVAGRYKQINNNYDLQLRSPVSIDCHLSWSLCEEYRVYGFRFKSGAAVPPAAFLSMDVNDDNEEAKWRVARMVPSTLAVVQN